MSEPTVNGFLASAWRLLGRWRKPSGVDSIEFTPIASRALSHARDEAERHNHNFIGTEHILLGLIKLEQGGAIEVMKTMGLEPNAVRMAIEELVGNGPRQKLTGGIPWTPRVKRAVALAHNEAKALNHPQVGTVGTGHILLGLLREGDGVAPRVLKKFGIELEKTRQAFVDLVARKKAAGPGCVPEGAAVRPDNAGNEPAGVSTPRTERAGVSPQAPRAESEYNFTTRAHLALAQGRREANRFNHNFLGTEHVLLGLIKTNPSVAANIIKKLGLDFDTVRTEIERQIGTGPDHKMIGNIPCTPRVKKVLELAQREARSLKHTHVGTGHVLLGLLREGDGVAGRVLKSLGVEVAITRQFILKEMESVAAHSLEMGSADASGSPPPHPSSAPTAQGAREVSMENFTPRTLQILVLARKEAERFHHNFLGTEHLLLGIIDLRAGVAVNVLQKFGLSLETIRSAVERQMRPGPDTEIFWHIPYTPRSNRVFELAQLEARALGHTYVGTEHILLGLLREADGVAARVLRGLGMDSETTRREILRELDPNFNFPAEPDSSKTDNDPPSRGGQNR